MYTLTLLAQEPVPLPKPPPPGDLFDRPEFWWGTGGLVAALIAGAVVISYVDRWRKRQALADQAESGEELTGFRAMFERGEITEAEYAKLRQKVAARVKTPAKPAAGGEAAAGADPTAAPPAAPGRPGVTGPLPDDYFDDPPPSANGTPGPNRPPA